MVDLTGKKVAFLLTDGYEDSELTSPWEAVEKAGAAAELVAPKVGEVEGELLRAARVGREPGAEVGHEGVLERVQVGPGGGGGGVNR